MMSCDKTHLTTSSHDVAKTHNGAYKSVVTDSVSDSLPKVSSREDRRGSLRNIRNFFPIKNRTCPSRGQGPALSTLLSAFRKAAPRDQGRSPYLRELLEFTRRLGCAACSHGTNWPFMFNRAHTCEVVFDAIPAFITMYAASQISFETDEQWGFMMHDILSFYSWCIRQGYYARDQNLERGLIALLEFEILRIPADIIGLMVSDFWAKMDQIASPEYIKYLATEKNQPIMKDSYGPWDESEEWLVIQVSKVGWHLKSCHSEVKRFLPMPVEVARVGHCGMRLKGMKLVPRGRFWAPKVPSRLSVHPSLDLFTPPSDS